MCSATSPHVGYTIPLLRFYYMYKSSVILLSIYWNKKPPYFFFFLLSTKLNNLKTIFKSVSFATLLLNIRFDPKWFRSNFWNLCLYLDAHFHKLTRIMALAQQRHGLFIERSNRFSNSFFGFFYAQINRSRCLLTIWGEIRGKQFVNLSEDW